jgi:hypothetical protein
MHGSRTGGVRTLRREAARPALVVAVVIFGLSLLLPAHTVATSLPAGTAVTTSWSNGQVLCTFDSTTPAVTVSSPTLNGTGLSGALSQVVEVGAKGVVATAIISGGVWAVANQSTDDAYEVTFVGEVPIHAVGATEPTGAVDLQVSFILPAYAGADSRATNEVVLAVGLSNWTWENSADSLDLVLPFAPAVPGTEHLVAGGMSGALLTGVATTSGQTLQYLSSTQQAVASGPASGATHLSVTPVVVTGTQSANVTIAFGSEAGAFRQLNYTTAIGIPLPATIAGVPILDFAVVGGAAVLASLGIAAGVRVVRARPSDLEFVEE